MDIHILVLCHKTIDIYMHRIIQWNLEKIVCVCAFSALQKWIKIYILILILGLWKRILRVYLIILYFNCLLLPYNCLYSFSYRFTKEMISLYVTEIRFTTDIWKIATSHQIGISRRRESREGVERQKRLASHGSQLSKFDFVTILFGIVFLDARSADCDFNAREAIRFQRDLFESRTAKTMNKPNIRH